MMNDDPHIAALQALGYTEQEARFLYLVATHSGYFVARQFLAFAGVQWGKRTTLLWNKLRSHKHARSHSLPRHRAVYHLFARELYRQLGCENLRNRRRHEVEYIQISVAILDFVLANPGLSYLETEGDKVAFFCRDLKIEAQHLPAKTYPGRRTTQPAVCYFVDRFPMFFEEPQSAARIITFSFVQGSEASLTAFAHHLRAYASLFRELREFRFLYLSRIEAHFARARELFHALVTVPLQANPAGDLLRYFAIRKAWDLHEYGSVSAADLEFRNQSKERFAGERFEHIYRAWKADRVPESQIRATFPGHHLLHTTHFEARVLKPFTVAREAEEEHRAVMSFGNQTVRRNTMSIIKKAPAVITREFHLEEPVSLLLDDYAQFIESSADHVLNSAIKKTLWRDQDYRIWREQKKGADHGFARSAPETAAKS
jgi:hypothetical protein